MSTTDRKRGEAPGLRTRLVHAGRTRSPLGETSEALFLSSGFVYEDAEEAAARFADRSPGYTYSRVANPTVRMFEERMAALEGAEEATATASGMAAVHAALMCQLRAGDRVVASNRLFGSCHYILTELLPRFGVGVELVEAAGTDAWAEALATPAACVFLETPSNPTLDLVDIRAVARLARAAGARTIVDNVFATPLGQQPMALGADLVVYSATKHIDGQGRCLGGVVLSDAAFKKDLLLPWCKNTGPSLSPFNAWVLLKGLETLDLRVERHVANATALAEYLEQHPEVSRTLYPGLDSHPQRELALGQMTGGGSVIAFRVAGGRSRAFAVMNRLQLIAISNNLGDARSLATHPATTTHRSVAEGMRLQLGITDDLIRLSVGLEDVDDLVADLDRALRA